MRPTTYVRGSLVPTGIGHDHCFAVGGHHAEHSNISLAVVTCGASVPACVAVAAADPRISAVFVAIGGEASALAALGRAS